MEYEKIHGYNKVGKEELTGFLIKRSKFCDNRYDAAIFNQRRKLNLLVSNYSRGLLSRSATALSGEKSLVILFRLHNLVRCGNWELILAKHSVTLSPQYT